MSQRGKLSNVGFRKPLYIGERVYGFFAIKMGALNGYFKDYSV